MAETLGSLCDKLTVVKLKQWHSTNEAGLRSLAGQQARLVDEIDEFLAAAASGSTPSDRLTFAANKVLPGGDSPDTPGSGPTVSTIGDLVSRLATTNCALWHEQEKVYEFHRVAPVEKDAVVARLAALNLERNRWIDAIDRALLDLVARRQEVA